VNVLITSASRKVALVRAFRSAVGAVGGGEVYAGDISRHSPALFVADHAVIMPRSGSADFVDWLARFCKQHEIGLVVPTRDEELPLFARHAQAFLARGTRIAVSPAPTIALCQDKSGFFQFCAAKGFAAPRVLQPADIGARDYPVFVKPSRGKGGRGAARADDATSLSMAIDSIDAPIVQEFCDLPEYTLDVFADFDGRVVSVVPRERIVLVGGESYVSRTRRDRILINRGRELAENIGLVGHGTIQCFYGGEEPKFIEINPRYGGAANLGFAAGHHTPEYLVRLTTGQSLAPMLGEFDDGLTMLRFTEDMFLTAEEMRGSFS